MIALYKDPEGESVFDKYEPPSFKTQQQAHTQHHQQQHTTESTAGIIDSLKKRIHELEDMLELNQHQPEMEVLFCVFDVLIECMSKLLAYRRAIIKNTVMYNNL